MSPTTIPQPLPLVSQEFASHCIVTVKTGTNYSHALHRADVQSHLSLRFDGAYPLQIKGIKEQGEFVGFELGLTGHSELEQLVLALEAAAAQLRAQSQQPAEPALDLLTLAAEPVDRLGLAQEQVERREQHVLRLLVLYGEQSLPGGGSVAQHLLHKLRNAPLTSARCAGLWALSAAAFQAGTAPTQQGWLARQWLGEQASVEDVALVGEFVEEQQRYARAEALVVRAGFKREVDQLPTACAQVLGQLYLARIGVEKEQVVAEMAALEPEPEGQELSPALTGLMLRFQDAGRREREALTRLGLPTA